MPVWDDLLTEDERKVLEVFRQPKTLGTRPAILVIDVNYAFVGRKPENIVTSVQDYRTSCGERGWEGVANLQTFLAVGRKVGYPLSIRRAPPGRAGALPGPTVPATRHVRTC